MHLIIVIKPILFPMPQNSGGPASRHGVTQEYLNTRPAAQIERLMQRIKEGRIEVTAMLFNMAEIADENIMVDF